MTEIRKLVRDGKVVGITYDLDIPWLNEQRLEWQKQLITSSDIAAINDLIEDVKSNPSNYEYITLDSVVIK